MIYEPPTLGATEEDLFAKLDEFRAQLRFYLARPRRWYGSLRRETFVRVVQGSNSIEGYNASVDDVAAVVDGDEPRDADAETRNAIAGCRDAMTYILQIAGTAEPLETATLRALHFMMLKHDLSKNPGRWRPGAVWVHNAEGDVVYTAPDREIVEDLVSAAVNQLNGSSPNTVIRAAIAHLNLVMIHPFSDGNGRMARAVQSFVLASDGVLAPEFSSIEEYLGHHTPAYYQILADTGRGMWNPRRDSLPWVRFCLDAHVHQATTTLRRIRETEALWDHCEQLTSAAKLPDRCVGALNDAARGRRLQRVGYIKIVASAAGETISQDTATRDLRALTAAGLLTVEGEKRGRTYLASSKLREAWAEVRRSRPSMS